MSVRPRRSSSGWVGCFSRGGSASVIAFFPTRLNVWVHFGHFQVCPYNLILLNYDIVKDVDKIFSWLSTRYVHDTDLIHAISYFGFPFKVNTLTVDGPQWLVDSWLQPTKVATQCTIYLYIVISLFLKMTLILYTKVTLNSWKDVGCGFHRVPCCGCKHH